MGNRIVTKKRKYLIIQLACASSSNWSSMYSNAGCGCNNGIDEENEAMLTCFMGGLNREIQTILEYKEYHNITRLFHLACTITKQYEHKSALEPAHGS